MPDGTDSQNPIGNSDGQSPGESPVISAINQRILALESESLARHAEKQSDDLAAAIKKGEWCLIGINGLLLIATVVIACIYYGQLTQMRTATEASTKAAALASDALDQNSGQFDRTVRQLIYQTVAQAQAAQASMASSETTRLELTQVQRAFVSVIGVDGVRTFGKTNELEAVQFTINFKNSGITPTKWLVLHFSEQPHEGTLPASFTYPDQWDTEMPHVNTKTVVGPTATLTTTPITIAAPLIKAVISTNGKFGVYFYGWVKYRDIFPKTPDHLTRFCFRLNGFIGDPFDPNPNALVKPLTSDCPNYNCYDDQCKSS